jgi:hypothetical protein
LTKEESYRLEQHICQLRIAVRELEWLSKSSHEEFWKQDDLESAKTIASESRSLMNRILSRKGEKSLAMSYKGDDGKYYEPVFVEGANE